MPLDSLKKLYAEGHDVYSHSYSHYEFHLISDIEDLDMQLKKSKEWLEQNGFLRSSNIIVYPGGLGPYKTYKKDIIRNYYQYGVDAEGNGGLNIEPLDNWQICRFNADTASIYTLKEQVIKAKEHNSLIVFMNHAYELNKNRQESIDKICNLINFIKTQGVTIMPLSQALRIKGNIKAEGDYNSKDAIFVSANGLTHINNNCVYIDFKFLFTLIVICLVCLLIKMNMKI
jgi:peptidoglycan/xylan/chitin deacetylase (PgdA/CDA1 family)